MRRTRFSQLIRIFLLSGLLALSGLFAGGCREEPEPIVITPIREEVVSETPLVTATTERVIADFEQLDGWYFVSYPPEVNGYLTQSFGSEPVHDGDFSARMVYDFTQAAGTTAAAYAKTATLLPLNWDELSIWVYGDGSQHWLRAEFIDTTGESFVGDLATQIDWSNSWKLCTIRQSDLLALRNENARRHPPLALTRLYIVVLPGGKHTTGEIFFDSLTLQ